MSEPFKLFREGGTEAVGQACSTCRRIYALTDDFAIRCCDRRCADCGVALPAKGTWTCCDPCRAKRDAASEAAAVAKAERVPEAEYQGMVYYEGAWNDGYLHDADDFRDWWESEHEEATPLPSYVWACVARAVSLPAASTIIESACEDHYDDAYRTVMGQGDVEALQVAIDTFNSGISVQSWEPDYSRLVVLDGSAGDETERGTP